MRFAGSVWLRAIESYAEDAYLYCPKRRSEEPPMTIHHSTETAPPDATLPGDVSV